MMSGGYQKKNWKRGPGRGYSTKTQKRERGWYFLGAEDSAI